MFIENAGDHRLWDPAGSYRWRNEDPYNWYEGSDADPIHYIEHMGGLGNVGLVPLDTTDEQEAEIIRKILGIEPGQSEEWGNPRRPVPTCAASIAEVLCQVEPYDKAVSPWTVRPHALYHDLKEYVEEQAK